MNDMEQFKVTDCRRKPLSNKFTVRQAHTQRELVHLNSENPRKDLDLCMDPQTV